MLLSGCQCMLCVVHTVHFLSCTGVLNEKIAAIVRRQVTQDDVPLLQESSSVQTVFTWSWLTYCADEVA